jgi:hypothetical protein
MKQKLTQKQIQREPDAINQAIYQVLGEELDLYEAEAERRIKKVLEEVKSEKKLTEGITDLKKALENKDLPESIKKQLNLQLAGCYKERNFEGADLLDAASIYKELGMTNAAKQCYIENESYALAAELEEDSEKKACLEIKRIPQLRNSLEAIANRTGYNDRDDDRKIDDLNECKEKLFELLEKYDCFAQAYIEARFDQPDGRVNREIENYLVRNGMAGRLRKIIELTGKDFDTIEQKTLERIMF